MAIFLRGHERRKDGKTNTYWSMVENRRCADGRVVQRHVLYLGRLTPAQELSWEKTAAQFGDKPRLGDALPGLASERELQRQEAAAIGADDVVGIKTHIHDLGNLLEFMAIGTAVKRLPNLAPQSALLPPQAIIRDKDTWITADQSAFSALQKKD